MGIDYDANYGIGYEVEATDEISEEELEDGLQEYLHNELSQGFESFQVGNCNSGIIKGTYITVEEPFKNGLDLTQAKAALDKEIKRLKLKHVGEFNEVGGLLIWLKADLLLPEP